MRQVDGFLSEDGTFFPTEQQCLHYEASTGLFIALAKHPALSSFSPNDLDNIRRAVVLFIQENKDVIRAFIDTSEPGLFVDHLTDWDRDNITASIREQKERSGSLL